MLEFVSSNWEALAAVAVATHGLALAIVNLTPTPKDDKVLAKVYKWVERVAGLFSEKTKDKGA